MVKTPQLALHGTEEHLDPASLDAASCFRQVSLALATTNHHKSPQIHQGWASLVRKMCLWTASHLSGKVDAFAPPVKPRGGGISALAAAASEAALRPAKGAERVVGLQHPLQRARHRGARTHHYSAPGASAGTLWSSSSLATLAPRKEPCGWWILGYGEEGCRFKAEERHKAGMGKNCCCLRTVVPVSDPWNACCRCKILGWTWLICRCNSQFPSCMTMVMMMMMMMREEWWCYQRYYDTLNPSALRLGSRKMPWCSTDPPLATWLRPNLWRVGRFEVQFHAVDRIDLSDMSSLDGGVSH